MTKRTDAARYDDTPAGDYSGLMEPDAVRGGYDAEWAGGRTGGTGAPGRSG